jgi:hypothetical protein
LELAKEFARKALRTGGEAQATEIVGWGVQHLVVILARQNQARLAAQLLGYVNEALRKSEFQRQPTEQWSYEQLMAALRERLSEEQIAKLCAEGATWTEDRAIEEALKF